MRPRRSHFSIGSAPLTSITKSDAQISGGETRQDYKDPVRFPGSSLVRSPVPAFRFTGVIPLLWPRLSHSTPDTQFRKAVRSKLDCMHEPPFSPTAAPYPVTIVLSPTRKDTPKRHWQQPLVTGLAERVNVGDATEFLKWWPNYGYTGRTVFGICALLKPVTRLSSSPTDLTFENRPARRFFVYRARDYDEAE